MSIKNTARKAEPDKPLNQFEKVRLVQKAMNERHGTRFEEWSNEIFAGLINPYDPDGASLNTHTEFFMDLMLFLADPKRLAEFNERIPYGLRMIRIHSAFFHELQRKSLYEEYVTYHSLRHFYEEDFAEFKGFAEQYLTGDELQQVLDSNDEE